MYRYHSFIHPFEWVRVYDNRCKAMKIEENERTQLISFGSRDPNQFWILVWDAAENESAELISSIRICSNVQCSIIQYMYDLFVRCQFKSFANSYHRWRGELEKHTHILTFRKYNASSNGYRSSPHYLVHILPRSHPVLCKMIKKMRKITFR